LDQYAEGAFLWELKAKLINILICALIKAIQVRLPEAQEIITRFLSL